MPRGGGSRGGGGFRGGGFRGGGSAFRGGGFRGGGISYRGGSMRPSGRPFGRTGATRTVTRSPRGPYRHSYYRPHGFFYRPWWWYHRPWYYRWWWYSHWWAGYYYRPWYYSPMYMGGGIVFAIIFILILLPVAGVALAFPFSNADTDGTVNYRSTETLYYNEFWYEYEYIESGNEISYSIDSYVPINFAIWDQPFENLDLITLYDTEIDSITLPGDYREYLWLFLRPGSFIEFEFNSSAPIDFFIADGYDFYVWDELGGSPSFELNIEDTTGDSGSFPISIAKDYYVVFYNEEGAPPVDVDFTVDFTIANVVDFTSVEPEGFHANETYFQSGTFTVPSSGNWYFFIYFDPMNSIEESTTIRFDVTYDTGITSRERWIDIQPILIVILVIVVILILVAVISRRGQKKIKSLPSKQPTKPSAPKTEIKEKEEEKLKCIRCGATHSPDAEFCPQCGGKIDGRQFGTTDVTTPPGSKTCSYCGSKLTEKDNFCKWCGTKVENK
jgi:ribosomal protein L40E